MFYTCTLIGQASLYMLNYSNVKNEVILVIYFLFFLILSIIEISLSEHSTLTLDLHLLYLQYDLHMFRNLSPSQRSVYILYILSHLSYQ